MSANGAAADPLPFPGSEDDPDTATAQAAAAAMGIRSPARAAAPPPATTTAAAAAATPRTKAVNKAQVLRQQRRASLKVSLQLQALNMQQHGGNVGMSPHAVRQKAMQNRQRRHVLDHNTANQLTVKHTGVDLAGREVKTVERRRIGATSNAGSQLLKDSAAGGEAEVLTPTASDDGGGIGLINEFSEQMLPDIGKGLYKYAGGKTWFQLRRTKGFFNSATRTAAQALPAGVQPYTGSTKALPKEILRLEVLRRDKERLHVATQVNKAIDMLMDKLDNDDFANSVFTKETALHSKYREAVGEEEKKDIVTKGMFHYFDNDHSNEIDALEFAEGIRMMAQDAKRFSQASTDPEARAHAEASAASFDLLTNEELQGMFSVIAGDDGIAQMDEFVAFYSSDGTVTDPKNYTPQIVKTTKVVWTLLHESEDLMLQHGTLDEITAEQNLVQQTYQGMRDQATKTHRTRFPPYTNERIPYSIMPTAYLTALAEKEARLLEEEEHYRQMLSSLDDEAKAMEAAVSAAAATAAAAAAAAAAAMEAEEERRRRRAEADARKEAVQKQREARLRELEAEEARLAELKRQKAEEAAKAAARAAAKRERRRRALRAAHEKLSEASQALLQKSAGGLTLLGGLGPFVQQQLTT